ncbi:MAG TPA: 1-phosphofructokinase [Candidatus Limnocylindria bacterium]|nr:1-phosphofructokinase [Candidatus Limnocylindria bacterium]
MIYTVTLNPAVDKTVRIPGFAAGRVHRVEDIRLDPGGKGVNVSKAIQGLGGRSVAMGILGGAEGRWIRGRLEAMGLEGDFLLTREPTRTNLKIIDPLSRATTDVNEPGKPVRPAILARLLARLEARCGAGDVVVLSGKAPPGTDDTLYAQWCARLRQKGARVCVDADGPLLQYAAREKPDVIKPNEEEFARLTGKPGMGLPDIAREALALCASGVGLVAVSLGERGALFAHGVRVLHAQGLRVPVVSTVGAGDSMMAALALWLERGEPLEQMARTAVAAGAAAVMGDSPGVLSPETVAMLRKQVVLEEII